MSASDSDEDLADLPPIIKNGLGQATTSFPSLPAQMNTHPNGEHILTHQHLNGKRQCDDRTTSPFEQFDAKNGFSIGAGDKRNHASTNFSTSRRIIKAKTPPGASVIRATSSRGTISNDEIDNTFTCIETKKDQNRSTNSVEIESERDDCSEQDADSQGQEGQGQEQEHGDVYRAPTHASTFSYFMDSLQDTFPMHRSNHGESDSDDDYHDSGSSRDDRDEDSIVSDDDDDDDEECYCPGCVSGRHTAPASAFFSPNRDDEDNDDGNDEDNDDEYSSSDDVMPPLKKRSHKFSDLDSNSNTTEEENQDDNENVDDDSVNSDTTQCAICFSAPSREMPLITLPCCGYSREGAGDGQHPIHVESTSTTRFCKPCIIKTLQSQDTTFPFNVDCVGECPRCRRVIAVNNSRLLLKYTNIDVASFHQSLRHARYKGNDTKNALVTIAFANPTFLPNELLPNDQDCLRQFCSWGIVNKKEGREDVYTMNRESQDSLKAYVINFLANEDGGSLPGMIIAAGDICLAGLYALLNLKLWTAARLWNQSGIVFLTYFFRLPVLGDVWQEAVMAGLNCFLVAMILQVALFVIVYGAICYISVKLMKVLMEMSLRIKEKWNDAERPSLVDIYVMSWGKDVKISDLLFAGKSALLFGFAISWFVGILLVSKYIFVRNLLS